MHCHRILSVFIALCLFVSLTCCLIGLFSRHWWYGQFEAQLTLNNHTNVKDSYRMHWLFGLNFGVMEICWRSLQPKLTSDSDNYEIVPPLNYCAPHGGILKLQNANKNVEDEMEHFRNIFICLIVAIIFNMLAFSFAFFKLPCVIKCKKPLITTTIILTIISAIAILIGLFIANDNLFYDAPFMKIVLSTPPYFGQRTPATATMLLEKVFTGQSFSALSEVFEKGYSFVVTCVVEVFLLLAVVLSIIENWCYHRSLGDDYIIDDSPK